MSDDAGTFRRVPFEIFTEGNLDVIDEVFAEDYVEHAAPPDFPPGREGLHTWVGMIRAAFPSFRYEILDQMQDGDKHLGYIRGSGTMEGDFMGMPASGKSAEWDEMHIARFQNGKIVEHWAVVDQFGMLSQLGFIPENPGG